MKKMMSVIVVLAMVCGVSSSALSESRVAVIRNGEIFKVIYKCSDLTNVKVTISNDKGERIFSEELISTHGFIRPYNFATMPKGDYTVCVIDADGKKTEKICFNEAATKVNKKWLAHVATLGNDHRKVLVAVPAQGTSDFSMNIYDKDDQLVYTEDCKLEKEFACVLNLKALKKGATICLTNNVTGETRTVSTE